VILHSFINKKALVCLAQDYNTSTIVAGFLPLAAFAISFLIFKVACKKVGKISNIGPITFILVTPGLVKTLLEVSICDDIGGTMYLRYDTKVECGGSHTTIQIMGIVLLGIWGKQSS
jgi:hypothetical protein